MRVDEFKRNINIELKYWGRFLSMVWNNFDISAIKKTKLVNFKFKSKHHFELLPDPWATESGTKVLEI